MAKVVIVGDGPGGLSAALFLARAEQDVVVFGQDQTAMHYAYLNNYLGVPAISGSDFQRVSRDQAVAAGVDLVAAEVTACAKDGDGFTVTLGDGSTVAADYLILSEGRNHPLAGSLGLEDDSGTIATDREGRTSDPNVYVVGRSARPERSQAIISAGAGAVAAVDIISRETGKDYQDWDSPPK